MGLKAAFLGNAAGRGTDGRSHRCCRHLSLLFSPSPAAAAHFSFCRSLLEHTVSAENLSYRLQRSPGTSLTWHDGRSQRSEGARAVKLLRQPGTEGAQVPAGLWGWHHPHGFEGE